MPSWRLNSNRNHFMKTFLFMAAFLSSMMSWVSGAVPLAVGATAPTISGTNQDGKTVDLGALYKTGYVLVYFYPKAGTRGCTAEACSLRDAFADLSKENLTVVGVSHDTVDAQKKFAVQYKLPFDLIADPDGKVYAAFGVPSMINRQSFLMKDGKVIWVELKASTKEQADDVKKALATANAPAATAPAASATPAANPS
jgi:peroxiredoxin Q/BCP